MGLYAQSVSCNIFMDYSIEYCPSGGWQEFHFNKHKETDNSTKRYRYSIHKRISVIIQCNYSAACLISMLLPKLEHRQSMILATFLSRSE